jgi:hypothetical protein
MQVVEVEVVMAPYWVLMLLVLTCTETINLVVEVEEPLVIKTEVTEAMGLS